MCVREGERESVCVCLLMRLRYREGATIASKGRGDEGGAEHTWTRLRSRGFMFPDVRLNGVMERFFRAANTRSRQSHQKCQRCGREVRQIAEKTLGDKQGFRISDVVWGRTALCELSCGAIGARKETLECGDGILLREDCSATLFLCPNISQSSRRIPHQEMVNRLEALSEASHRHWDLQESTPGILFNDEVAECEGCSASAVQVLAADELNEIVDNGEDSHENPPPFVLHGNVPDGQHGVPNRPVVFGAQEHFDLRNSILDRQDGLPSLGRRRRERESK